jgi:hypothetical protein
VAKYINTDVKVVVNNVNLSDHAFRVSTPAEKEQVDVSGFSATGTREFLPGVADQTIEVSFLQDFGTNSVHQTLEPLFRLGTTFPLFGGTASLFTYNGLDGELNARGELAATFKPAAGSRFAWGTVAP